MIHSHFSGCFIPLNAISLAILGYFMRSCFTVPILALWFTLFFSLSSLLSLSSIFNVLCPCSSSLPHAHPSLLLHFLFLCVSGREFVWCVFNRHWAMRNALITGVRLSPNYHDLVAWVPYSINLSARRAHRPGSASQLSCPRQIHPPPQHYTTQYNTTAQQNMIQQQHQHICPDTTMKKQPEKKVVQNSLTY